MPTTINTLPAELSEPGQYKLAGSLSATGDYALKISGPNITIDLAGHRLEANGPVAILANAPGLSVYGGEIRCEAVAVASEPQYNAHNSRFSNLKVRGDIHLPSDHLIFENCDLGGWAYGVHAGSHALVSRCQVSGSTLGIEVGPGSSVVHCQVKHCEDGVYALAMGEFPCLLESVEVRHCRGLGLRLDGPGRVVSCVVCENGTELESGGILAGPGALVENCTALDNLGGDINIVEPTQLVNNRTTTG